MLSLHGSARQVATFKYGVPHEISLPSQCHVAFHLCSNPSDNLVVNNNKCDMPQLFTSHHLTIDFENYEADESLRFCCSQKPCPTLPSDADTEHFQISCNQMGRNCVDMFWYVCAFLLAVIFFEAFLTFLGGRCFFFQWHSKGTS